MKIMFYATLAGMLFTTSIASSKDNIANQRWIANTSTPDAIWINPTERRRETIYFYTWTNSRDKVHSLTKKNEEYYSDDNNDYLNADIIAMVTPLKFRIIPYSKDESIYNKNIEYIAKIDVCFKGSCDKKTMHYRISHEFGDGIEIPDKTPIIYYFNKNKDDGMYHPVDSWAWMSTSVKAQNHLKKALQGKKNQNKKPSNSKVSQ